MPAVAIIDYGSGNLRSAEKALIRASTEAHTGHQIIVTNDPAIVAEAERIVLPGVGAFSDCMRGLSSLTGMIPAMEEAVLKRKVPFLGICVGMQLLADVGREHGDHKGLGWIKGEVVKLAPADPSLKIPHMGWNELKVLKPHALANGMAPKAEAYFLHSYHLCTENSADVIATTDYGGAVTAIIAHDNIAGMQFHPEKSQALGLALLTRFLKWRP